MAAVSLKKGQKISLTKENAGLDKVIVGLGWDAAERETKGGFRSMFKAKPANIDCDASALMLKNGKLVKNEDIVYFGRLKHASGSVQHMGDNLTGDGAGDDEQIIVELSRVPQEYDRIIVVANIYQAKQRKQDFGMIKNAYIRIMDGNTNKELCIYNLSDNYDDMSAMIFGELYRRDNEWKFNAIGQGTQDESLSDLAKRYL